MDGFPEVFKGVSCLELATRNKERLDRTPYFLTLTRPLDLTQEKPSITDVHVVTPGAQLHGKELLRPQGPNQEGGSVQKNFTREQALEITLRAVVEPVLWKLQSDSHSERSLPENRGTPNRVYLTRGSEHLARLARRKVVSVGKIADAFEAALAQPAEDE